MKEQSSFSPQDLRPCNLRLLETRTQEHRLRTKDVAGWAHVHPSPGRRFVVFGRALTLPDEWRVVFTSPVVEILPISDSKAEFWTENSRYAVGWEGHHETMPPAEAFSEELARDLASEAF